MVASDTAVVSTGRSIVEAIDRKVHHTVMWILVLCDGLVYCRDGTCLRFDTFLRYEEIVIEITLVDKPEVAEGDESQCTKEKSLLYFPLCVEYAWDEREYDDRR